MKNKIHRELNGSYTITTPSCVFGYTDKFQAYYRLYLEEIGMYDAHKLDITNFKTLYNIFNIMNNETEEELLNVSNTI